MLIRLNVSQEDWQWTTPMHTSRFAEAANRCGYIVSQEANLADICLHDYRCGPPIMPHTVMFDRTDTSVLTEDATRHDEDPNVIGYLLPMRSLGDSIQGRPSSSEKPTAVVTAMLWEQLISYPFFSSDSITMGDKDIDVCFSGTVYYPRTHEQAPMKHRHALMDQWSQTYGLLSLGVFSSRPRLQSWQEHWELSKRTKVMVSPWGVCEVSWRDYEAVLGCCMIVKPQQPEMELTCNPWSYGSTVYCKPDYSDLREAIDRAMDLYSFDALWEHRCRMLEVGLDLGYLARSFLDAVMPMMTRQVGKIPMLSGAQQNAHAKTAFEVLFSRWKPDRIIELGCGSGEWSKHLYAMSGADMECWDITEGSLDVGVRRSGAIQAHMKEIVDSVKAPGSVLVVCDNGSKPGEFQSIAPHLKPGDRIAVHDYFDDLADFKAARRDSLWSWWEIHHGDVSDLVSEHLLKREHREIMRRGAWACWSK